MASIEEIRSALSQVAYPGFTKDIVSFGFVKEIKADAKPYIEIEITASSDEIASILKDEIKNKLALIGVNDFELKLNQPQMPRETSSKGKNLAPYIKNF
ncbi:MAG: iron-sulfur cluster assembly protein, partial [Campylobacterales bacterium]|nr:iron-sulfur cluster assembly protein [Campylobacterales bacterium]